MAENDNINLEPEIWVTDSTGNRREMRDDANDISVSDVHLDDDEVYDAIISNDYERFEELILSAGLSDTEAYDLFASARRDLEIYSDEDEDFDPEINEALTLQQRRARGRVMKRMKSRLKMARRIAARRKASPEKLKARAVKAARLAIKKRLAAQRDYGSLSPSEKQAVDRRMEKINPNAINRMAAKLLPGVRKKEMERMARRSAKKPIDSSAGKTLKKESEERHREVMQLAEATILKLQEDGVCEFITLKQMKEFEKVVDALFKKFKIDFNFTKHFAERMSDSRNDPCIRLQDLANFIKKIYAEIKSGKNSLIRHKDTEVVLKDLQQNLNIPVAVEYNRSKDELIIVNKTIMRKKNFSTPNKVVKY